MADGTTKDEQERRYSVEELGEYARSQFGVSPHVVAAVLAGESTKTFTFAQVEKALKNADKPVEPDNEGEADNA